MEIAVDEVVAVVLVAEHQGAEGGAVGHPGVVEEGLEQKEEPRP